MTRQNARRKGGCGEATELCSSCILGRLFRSADSLALGLPRCRTGRRSRSRSRLCRLWMLLCPRSPNGPQWRGPQQRFFARLDVVFGSAREACSGADPAVEVIVKVGMAPGWCSTTLSLASFRRRRWHRFESFPSLATVYGGVDELHACQALSVAWTFATQTLFMRTLVGVQACLH